MTIEKYFEEDKIKEVDISEEEPTRGSEAEESVKKAVENLESFYELRGGDENDQIVKKWEGEYIENPNLFFSEENIKSLYNIPAGERLLMLARACGSLQVSTDIVERYYRSFPEDLEAVKMLFVDCGGHPDNGFEFNLFSVSADLMIKTNPNLLSGFRSIQQYLEMSERRRHAPDFILDGTRNSYVGEFGRFGSAADGLAKALDEAEELNFKGDHFIDPEQIFTMEYDALNEEQRAEFLRGCVNTLHFNLLFHETYNSCFTEELRDNTKARMQMRGASGYRFGDVAHSMIYKTYQPLSAYNSSQEGFEYMMDSCCESVLFSSCPVQYSRSGLRQI